MMQPLETHNATCPYCGETISLLLDCSAIPQTYIEDCSVCCRPILVTLTESAGGSLEINLRHENESG